MVEARVDLGTATHTHALDVGHVGGPDGCVHSKDSETSLPKLSKYVKKANPSLKSLPSSIDWTDYNGKSYVTPVKDQGMSVLVDTLHDEIDCMYKTL